MDFLNTLLLPLLSASMLPILIHLLNKQKVQIVKFPSIRFILSLQRSKMRRLKLKQILLLIIRTLIIFLLVAAFTRPVLQGPFAKGVSAHAATSVILLMDNSYSMGWEREGGILLDAAKGKAQELLGLLNEGDDVQVVAFSQVPEPQHTSPTHDFTFAAQLVNAIPLSAGETDQVTALRYALEQVKNSHNLNREIVMITDRSSGLPRGEGGIVASMIDSRTRIIVIPLSGDEDVNLGITSVEFPPQLLEVGQPISLRTQVRDFGDKPRRSNLASLYLDGKRIAQRDFDVDRQSTVNFDLSMTVTTRGRHSGWIELPDDPLPADNRRYFAFRIPDHLKVLLVGESREATRYISLALRPDTLSDFIQAKEIPASRIQAENLGDYDAVILAGVRQIDATALGLLQDYVQGGGGLLVTFGRDASPSYYTDQLLGRLCPVSLKGLVGGTGLASSFLTVDRWDFTHPILSIFSEIPKDKFPQLRAYAAVEVLPRGDTRPIAYYNNGDPFLLEGKLGQGKTLFLTTAVDPVWSGLPVSGMLVPLLHRSLQYLASDIGQFETALNVGEVAVRPLPPKVTANALELVTPESGTEHLKTTFHGLTPQVKVTDLPDPGVYLLLAEKDTVDMFAANVNLTESQTLPLGIGPLKSALPAKVEFVDPGADLRQAILAARYGREIWRELLAAALLLLVLESILGGVWRNNRGTDESDLPGNERT